MRLKYDEMFIRSLDVLPRWSPPPFFVRMFKRKNGDPGDRWLNRNGFYPEDVLSMGWSLLILSLTVSFGSMLLLFAILGSQMITYGIVAAMLLPVVIVSLIVNAPHGFAMMEEKSILQESATAIGCMSMSMRLSPSLEKALVFSSERCDGAISLRFREVIWSSLMQAKRTVSGSLSDASSSFTEMNENLRHALHMILSATNEKTREGMDRLLDKANALVLAGMRDAVDRYVISLSLPTMVLFSLGVLLPVMLFAMLPMLSLGIGPDSASSGSSGPSAPISSGSLAFLILLVLPGASLIYSRSVLNKNPMARTAVLDLSLDRATIIMFMIWAAACMIAILVRWGPGTPYVISLAAVLPPCIAIYYRTRAGHISKNSRYEKELISALYQLGNMMSGGQGLESALEELALARPGTPFSEIIKAVLHRCNVTGESIERSFRNQGGLRSISPVIEGAYLTVAECSLKDSSSAGKIALDLAQMLTDMKAGDSKIEEKLRSVVDMMRSTSVVFAPLVLGVTSSLFFILSSYIPADASMIDDIVLIAGIYVVELCLVISYFTTFLMGKRSWSEVGYDFASKAPIALGVFIATSIVCRIGLAGPL